MSTPAYSKSALPFALIINGSINSGKTSVARELRALVPLLAHVEIDSLGDFLPELPLEQKIPINLRNATLVARTFLDEGFPVVVTYPLSNDEYRSLVNALSPYPVHAATLAPPLQVALKNRGTRELTPWEEARIRFHYRIGIPNPAFGQIFDNANEEPAGTAQRILSSFALSQ